MLYRQEHMERIIAKLIGVSKVRLTPRTPMVNARTIEGYRSMHPCGYFTLRQSGVCGKKVKKYTLTPEEMIKEKSFQLICTSFFRLYPRPIFPG